MKTLYRSIAIAAIQKAHGPGPLGLNGNDLEVMKGWIENYLKLMNQMDSNEHPEKKLTDLNIEDLSYKFQQAYVYLRDEKASWKHNEEKLARQLGMTFDELQAKAAMQGLAVTKRDQLSNPFFR